MKKSRKKCVRTRYKFGSHLRVEKVLELPQRPSKDGTFIK